MGIVDSHGKAAHNIVCTNLLYRHLLCTQLYKAYKSHIKDTHPSHGGYSRIALTGIAETDMCTGLHSDKKNPVSYKYFTH